MSFNKTEWMADNNLRVGRTWVSFIAGTHMFEFCDIRMQDGTEIGPCFILLNNFVNITTEEEKIISLTGITQVKYYLTIEPDKTTDNYPEEDEEILSPEEALMSEENSVSDKEKFYSDEEGDSFESKNQDY